MREIYKGNVSIPYAAIHAFLECQKDAKAPPEKAAEVVRNLMQAMQKGMDDIHNGLDKSNLTVCTGKAVYVSPFDLQRFMSGEIPRMTVYRKRKDNHSMPLYQKHKPDRYIHRAIQKAKKNGK